MAHKNTRDFCAEQNECYLEIHEKEINVESTDTSQYTDKFVKP